MAFCKHCGKEIVDDAVVCVGCGRSVDSSAKKVVVDETSASGWWTVLGFFFPLIGLILFLVWEDSHPIRAKKCGRGALIGVITGIAMAIVWYLLFFFFFIMLGISLNWIICPLALII